VSAPADDAIYARRVAASVVRTHPIRHPILLEFNKDVRRGAPQAKQYGEEGRASRNQELSSSGGGIQRKLLSLNNDAYPC